MKVAIIGGGAAGCFAAIVAAKCGHQVTIFEKNERIGKKILVTGNGRCNLANKETNSNQYVSFHGENKKWLDEVLKQCDTQKVLELFHEMGLITKAKEELIYPSCQQASVVLDTLRYKIKEYGIHVTTNSKVTGISEKNGYWIETGSQKMKFDRVIICTGGKAAPKTGSDGDSYKLAKMLGISVTQLKPALVQLIIQDDFFKKNSGIRFDGTIKCKVEKSTYTETGELQITDYGISGIPSLQMSLYITKYLPEKKITGEIDFLPVISEESLFRELENRVNSQNGQTGITVEEGFTGILNNKLLLHLLKKSNINPSREIGEINKNDFIPFIKNIKSFPITISGCQTFDNAQVTLGGITIDEVSTTMESKKHKGVFFAGEALDIAGRCGGFNLQWAWCSAYVAARNLE